ncbi:Holliday junction branch migration DNA helicase RuvB [Anaplasmataceae bacterium AB001_6]|nr:Holliday junction branch migration DNA helicase RuvB [Anaplasmataceae bacterium AB001_6]
MSDLTKDLECKQSDKVGISFRPQCLADFVGQTSLKDNLSVFIEAAKKKDDSLDHILLHGPPGLGKTTLANVVAKELNVNIVSTSGPLLTKPGDLAAIMTNLHKNDVLFIDEIHRLSTKVEEVLYAAMEDFKLDLIIGSGPSARTVSIDLPKFTIVGATTRIGLISKPLRDRFGIPVKLEFYTIEEQKELLSNIANTLKMPISEQALYEIAKRSRGTPRIAIRLLKRLYDFFLVKCTNTIDIHFTIESLDKLHIDERGLDKSDRDYLKFIYENYPKAAVGINTISSALSEQKSNIEEAIEPYLIKIGFINKTKRGRILTEKGLTHIKNIKEYD